MKMYGIECNDYFSLNNKNIFICNQFHKRVFQSGRENMASKLYKDVLKSRNETNKNTK